MSQNHNAKPIGKNEQKPMRPHHPPMNDAKMTYDTLTTGQRILKRKHGTPAEFAKSCYECVPLEISMDEAMEAIEKYNREWDDARRTI